MSHLLDRMTPLMLRKENFEESYSNKCNANHKPYPLDPLPRTYDVKINCASVTLSLSPWDRSAQPTLSFIFQLK